MVRLLSPVPVGRTARRLEWAHLPPALRRLVERRCGAAVVEARSQGAGFTPGLASVLVCEDGSHHFLKAASRRAQRSVAASYEHEARSTSRLSDTVPAPRLRWHLADDDWVVLGLEHVEADPPRRPWLPDELQRCLDLCTAVAASSAGEPGLDLPAFPDDVASWPALWGRVRTALPHLAVAPVLDEAAGLAAAALEVAGGDTLVHGDLRDDNLLLAADGRTVACDWSWPTRGAAWVDTVTLLLGPRGDGLDVEAVLGDHPLTRDVPAGHVDRFLALLAGYGLASSLGRAPSTSPWLRAHQQHHGAVAWDWLAERRGWAVAQP